MNHSKAWQKQQVVNNDYISVDLYSSILMTNRYIMSNASSKCSDAMKIHKC